MKKLLIVMLCAFTALGLNCSTRSSYLSYLNPFSYFRGNQQVEQSQNTNLGAEEEFEDEEFVDEDLDYDIDAEESDEDYYEEPVQLVKQQPSMVQRIKSVISGTTDTGAATRTVGINAQAIEGLQMLRDMTMGTLQQLAMDSLSMAQAEGVAAKGSIRTAMDAAKRFVSDEALTSMRDYSNDQIAVISETIDMIIENLS